MNYRGINHDFAQQGRIYYFTLFVSRLGLAAWCLARMGTGKPPPTATVLCYDIMMAGVWRERIMQ